MPVFAAVIFQKESSVSEQDDQIFLKRFSLVIVGLVVFAILIIFMAIWMNERIEPSGAPMRAAAIEKRVQPVFGVYAGDTGRAAAQAAAEAAGKEQEQQVAFEGSTDGQMIYQQVCQACHQTGAAGAPQLVAAQWEDRMDKGMDQLVSNAINGIGAMPAKGGRTDLTDEQVRASVEYMLDQVQQ